MNKRRLVEEDKESKEVKCSSKPEQKGAEQTHKRAKQVDEAVALQQTVRLLLDERDREWEQKLEMLQKQWENRLQTALRGSFVCFLRCSGFS